MRGKQLRDKLAGGRPIFTAFVTFYAPRLVELLARSGADQIFLDAEHGPLSERDCEDMIRAADLFDVPCQVRVPVNQPHVILRFLDIGASNIMVPHVTTRADAERAVAACRYPPEGERGFAMGRGGAHWGLSPAEYMTRANEEVLVTALFEDAAGLDDIDALAQTPGLDGIFVGRNDLASSMGLPGQPWHEEVERTVGRVRDACKRHGMPFGAVPRNRDDLKAQVEQGHLMISLGPVEWGIEVCRDTVAALTQLRMGAAS
jgi:2-keto-3-deoxy-L-rhamnonate aldolase RhmA